MWVRLPPPPPMKGKIPLSDLAGLLGAYSGAHRDEVILGASALNDSAVVHIDGALVVSTDPITGAEDYVSELSVYVNANDVRVSGGEPVAYLATLLLPEDYPLKNVESLFAGFDEGLRLEGAQLIGGHTEFTSSVNWPVVVGTMFGRRIREFSKDLFAEGQQVVLAGELGLEGRMILTNTYRENIKRISIKHIMETVVGDPGVVFAHDLTEGGLVSGLWELLRGTRFSIDAIVPPDAVSPELAMLATRRSFNPYKLLSSGAVLLVCSEADRVVGLLHSQGIHAYILGSLKRGGTSYLNGVALESLDPEGPDALWLL
ncbi:hydrogenase expression/formation protein HypE [Coprothermobacteraceae bacterium]|nr:hydrogenase expression/formation protein HypE [Coprothermobacteraceae bacterium]